jgi:hypothetical protein
MLSLTPNSKTSLRRAWVGLGSFVLVALVAALVAMIATGSINHNTPDKDNDPMASNSLSGGVGNDTLGGPVGSGNDQLGGSRSSGARGPNGSNNKSDILSPKKKKDASGVPQIDTPDTDGGAVVPEPIDLSLLVAEQPKRRALSGISSPAQGGITGYAGVFIP